MTERDFYIDEQLGHAINYLVTGHGRIRERLEAIAASRLGHLTPEQFPEPLQSLVASIKERLGPQEGPYAAAIRAMTEDEASELASDILALHDRHDLYWREHGE